MTYDVAYIHMLVGPNYLPWKRKLINILGSKKLWQLVNGEHKKSIDVKYLVIWEEQCDQARGLIGQTVSDSLQVHIEAEDSQVKLWKTLVSLFDKSDNVYAYT